jgi:hypothetical protein
MSTGESWNGLMHDVMNVHPSACVFFFTYILLVAYLLFNLLVAIVLQQFHMEAEVKDPEEQKSTIVVLGGDEMAKFQDEWVRFDPFATQYIKAVELPLILRRLPQELCVLDENSDSVAVIRCLANLSVNVDRRGNIHFAETYIAVVQYAYNLQIARAQADLEVAEGKERRTPEVIAAEIPGLSAALLEGLMSQIVAHYPALATQQLTDKPIVEFYAAQRLQALWHRAQARRNWDAMLVRLRQLRDEEASGGALTASAAAAAPPAAVRKGLFGKKISAPAAAAGGDADKDFTAAQGPGKGERNVGFAGVGGVGQKYQKEESKDHCLSQSL